MNIVTDPEFLFSGQDPTANQILKYLSEYKTLSEGSRSRIGEGCISMVSRSFLQWKVAAFDKVEFEGRQ